VQKARDRVAGILRHGGLAIPKQERDDLVQEIMTEIWQAVNRARFDVSGGFWGFVEVVTSRRSIDWLRSQRTQTSLPDELPSLSGGPLGRALKRERGELAAEILAALDVGCRQLLVARLGDDLSYAEIARSTGKSEGALRVQLYRCIRRAREVWRRLRQDSAKESNMVRLDQEQRS